MQHMYVQVWNALWETEQIGPTLQHTGYCDWGFSGFCSASPSKFRDSVVNQPLSSTSCQVHHSLLSTDLLLLSTKL